MNAGKVKCRAITVALQSKIMCRRAANAWFLRSVLKRLLQHLSSKGNGKVITGTLEGSFARPWPLVT